MRSLIAILILLFPAMLHAQHPTSFFTKAEAASIKKDINRYPLLTRSYQQLKKEVDAQLGTDVDVPFPKDPAGGYTHDRHKANYMLMFNSAILFNIDGNTKYAKFVKDMLMKYAALNPTLGKHPQATSSSPGRIFWQALNDANWLVYAGMAYDMIVPSLTAAEKKIIVDGAFKPEVDYFTNDLQKWFDLIHNHGVWACAGVGIVGIATDNKDYVDMALYGTKKDGKSGFLAQLDGLFAPDGYYTEGPYYLRYAILPYYLFANSLHRARPELKIFQYRDRVLQKALTGVLQQTNLDGTFYPMNDAIKDKDFTSNELVTAMNIAWDIYGKDPGLLPIVKKQDRVMVSKGGASIAAAMQGANIPSYFPYRSIEFTDGVDGKKGGVSLLRLGKEKDQTTLVFKYTSHGLSHGHFDKLNYNLFDKGNEIITDYGSVRFIGVEQKYGGRYLKENDSWASQTIAHNTIVIDETSHFKGEEKIAEQFHSNKLFSNIGNGAVQVVAAYDTNAYANTKLHRTVYLLELPGSKKIVVDLFKATTAKNSQFDLPFYYGGHLINTSFKYQAFDKKQETLGKKNGYQFLWKEAEASVADTLVQLTFLNDKTFYSITSMVNGPASVFLTRSGASDPSFNLRHEPAMIIRQEGIQKSFASLIEIHGKYDPVLEFSSNAYPSVKKAQWLRDDDNYSVIEWMIGEKKLAIAQSNRYADKATEHFVNGIKWTGPFAVIYDGKPLR